MVTVSGFKPDYKLRAVISSLSVVQRPGRHGPLPAATHAAPDRCGHLCVIGAAPSSDLWKQRGRLFLVAVYKNNFGSVMEVGVNEARADGSDCLSSTLSYDLHVPSWGGGFTPIPVLCARVCL